MRSPQTLLMEQALQHSNPPQRTFWRASCPRQEGSCPLAGRLYLHHHWELVLSAWRSLRGSKSTIAANFPVRVTEVKPGAEISKNAYTIKTTKATHDITCLAYAIIETDRPGRFHPEKAKRLGVPEGPLWKQLQVGKEVNIDGKTVTPRQVIEEPRPGLKIVYAIDTRPSDAVKTLARDADLLLHDGGFAEDRRDKAKEYFHSTAREAARVAKAARVRKLALVHISAVTRDDSILLKQARSVFKATVVPKDLMVLFLKRSK